MFTTILNKIDGIVWGIPTIILILATGILLTIRLRGVQFTKLGLGIKNLFKKTDDGKGELSPFQALCTALSATIGTGNIVGVATAIAAGGPGALFWMWFAALLGTATKYTECMLAVKYREHAADGHVLGGPFYTIEKGMNVLDSIEHIYDESTRAMIRLPEELKHNIYCILKWLICEFSNLRVKDNLDLATKRIRFAEYIAAMYAAKLSKGIYRIADLGNKADLNSIQKAINIRPMYLIEEIQKSRLVNYRNMVNDSDGFAALKFTYKGIAGIGEKSQNSVANVFRAVNPSHLGRLDLNSSSATDPGLSGVLCPLCQIQDDGFFDNYKEPIFWEEDIAKLLNEYKERVGKKEIFEFKRKLSILDIDTPEPETEIELIKFIKPERFDTGIVEPGIPLEDGGVIRYGN